ncbi:hypothetical protein PG995_006762 [Apiospora arundinis]
MSDFFRLPRELRDQIYKHCLVVHAHALYPWRHPWSRRRWDFKPAMGLLRVSQVVSLEAAVVFYGRNLVDFELANPEQIDAFFRQIGGRNASHIRHLVVDIPEFNLPLLPAWIRRLRVSACGVNELLLDGASVSAYDVNKLLLIRCGCPNLQTLTASRANAYSLLEVCLSAPKPGPGRDEEAVTKALELIDAHFRAVPSLEKIALEVNDKLSVWPRSLHCFPSEFSDHTQKEMERLGWTISSGYSFVSAYTHGMCSMRGRWRPCYACVFLDYLIRRLMEDRNFRGYVSR